MNHIIHLIEIMGGSARAKLKFFFVNFESEKGGTTTCFFFSPVQRHLRLVANFDEIVKIHSTLGGNLSSCQEAFSETELSVTELSVTETFN